jgi:hypothetical protein
MRIKLSGRGREEVSVGAVIFKTSPRTQILIRAGFRRLPDLRVFATLQKLFGRPAEGSQLRPQLSYQML